MTTTLKQFCDLLQKCALKLEEEVKTSIETCRKIVISNEISDTKLALEKAKDYHSKEIITILSGIITNIKQIIYHENKIKQLNDKEKLTEEEIKKYSYVKRQVSAFSGGEKVVRRELRRVASENSVYCLETWENFLKEEEEGTKQALYSSNSLPNINTVPKRQSPQGKRKQKKLISSTFENILEDEEAKPKPMDSLSEEVTEMPSHFNLSTPDFNCDTAIRIDNNVKIEDETKDEETKEDPTYRNINLNGMLQRIGSVQLLSLQNFTEVSSQLSKSTPDVNYWDIVNETENNDTEDGNCSVGNRHTVDLEFQSMECNGMPEERESMGEEATNVIVDNDACQDAEVDTKPRIVGFVTKKNGI